MSLFTDRVALITGAGSGIGRQLALSLSAEGARIAALDLRAEPLEALAAALPGKTVAHAVADVTDLAGLRRAVVELEAKLGPTDLLIASAGIAKETPVDTYSAEDFAAQVHVNLIGVSNSIDAVLAGMKQRRRGHLVALSSLASFHGLPHMAGYCASKAGVNALLDSLRIELRDYGIAVTTLCPGFIRTPMTAPFSLPDELTMELGEAVRRMMRAIRARRSFASFPSKSTWQMRLLRWLPHSISDWLAANYLRSMNRK